MSECSYIYNLKGENHEKKDYIQCKKTALGDCTVKIENAVSGLKT